MLDLVALSALDCGSAVAGVISSFSNHGAFSFGTKLARNRATEELYGLPNTPTPFGTICQTKRLEGSKGPLDVFHVNPQAFLYFMIHNIPEFCSYLLVCQARNEAGYLTIVLYLDEATPGNQNRPDRGRASQCIYWSLLEFDSWFRSRDCGWLPFTYVFVTDQKKAGVSDSVLIVFTLDQFWNEDCPDFDFVILTPCGRQLRFNAKLVVADWPALKKVFSLKGHNGHVCCHHCINVLGHCDYFEDSHLFHFLSTEYSKFIKHTTETILRQVTKVETTAMNSPGDLKKIEMSTGFVYSPSDLMWNGRARSRLQLPHAAYTDWQHTIVASGGVGQYHLQQLVYI